MKLQGKSNSYFFNQFRLTQALKVECGKLTEHYREKMRKMDENYENNKKENERIKDNFVEKANQTFKTKQLELANLKDNHDDVKKHLKSKTEEIVNYEKKRNEELMNLYEKTKKEKKEEIEKITKEQKGRILI